MTFSDSLKAAAAKAGKLGNTECRIAFVFGNYNPEDASAVLAPLSECYAVCVRNSPPREYLDKIARSPAMISVNQGHWYHDKSIWGTPHFFVCAHNHRVLYNDGSTPLPSDARPEGYLRDLNELNPHKHVTFLRQSEMDRRMLNWANFALTEKDAKARFGQLSPEVITPTLLVPVPEHETDKEWLVLRQGVDLDNMVERVINHMAYVLPGVDLEAPDSGVLKPDGTGFNFVDGEGDTQAMSNPEKDLQRLIYRVFGAAVDVQLYPMFTTETRVAKRQAIFTPFKEQAENPQKRWEIDELKRLPIWQTLQYISVLASAATLPEVDGEARKFVNCDIAFTRKEPLVYFHENFPRVQRLKMDKSSCRSSGTSFTIDMIDVPCRVSMRQNKEKVKAAAAQRNAEAKAKRASATQKKTNQLRPVKAAVQPLSAKEIHAAEIEAHPEAKAEAPKTIVELQREIHAAEVENSSAEMVSTAVPATVPAEEAMEAVAV